MSQVPPSRSGATSILANVPTAPVQASRWRFPLRIKAILLDLDGTLMPTYRSLAALQYFEEQLEAHGNEVASFLADCRAQYDFESVLHNPVRARRAATHYASIRNVNVSSAVLRCMSSLQKQSFCVYEGVRDVLDHARRAGAFIAIYTNTSCKSAVRRLERSLLPPECFNAIWARNDLSIDTPFLLRDYADVILAYDYRKPDDTPLRELAAISGARHNEILFIGDAVNDLEVVYRDIARPRAIFCLQEKGAADISEGLSAFNARLRPGCPPLGLAAVNSRIDRYGIDGDIIRLSNGFIGLSALINSGRIVVCAPDRMPIVRDNRLIAVGRSSVARFHTFPLSQNSTREHRDAGTYSHSHPTR